jgi:hypothetical protein
VEDLESLMGKLRFEAVPSLLPGVHVSEADGEIDWAEFRGNNFNFVFIRCSVETRADSRFLQNVREARRWCGHCLSIYAEHALNVTTVRRRVAEAVRSINTSIYPDYATEAFRRVADEECRVIMEQLTAAAVRHVYVSVGIQDIAGLYGSGKDPKNNIIVY